jgi:hypothetical protein
MGGAVPPLHNAPSWRGVQLGGNDFIFTFVRVCVAKLLAVNSWNHPRHHSLLRTTSSILILWQYLKAAVIGSSVTLTEPSQCLPNLKYTSWSVCLASEHFLTTISAVFYPACNLLCNGYRWPFPRGGGGGRRSRGMKLTTHLHLLPPLPHMSSWRRD